jgi:hypothetical protein
MADLGVAGSGCDPTCPLLDLRALDLDRAPAHPADKVMVMTGDLVGRIDRSAEAVLRFAVRAKDYIDLTGVGEGLEVPVDRRQTYGLSATPQLPVQILRGAESVSSAKRGVDRSRLPGRAHPRGAKRSGGFCGHPSIVALRSKDHAFTRTTETIRHRFAMACGA